jgi:hypothetical protein
VVVEGLNGGDSLMMKVIEPRKRGVSATVVVVVVVVLPHFIFIWFLNGEEIFVCEVLIFLPP